MRLAIMPTIISFIIAWAASVKILISEFSTMIIVGKGWRSTRSAHVWQ